ncbi:MAG: hypothetical protein P1V29_07930, partial [Gammaproteobacteria bacterium]|nr:hypothetical protein [Gammaproteobacteria bacterium]
MKRLLMRFIVITFCLANLPVFGQAMGTKVDIMAADEAALIAALDIYGSSRPKAPDQGEGTLFRYTADGAN